MSSDGYDVVEIESDDDEAEEVNRQLTRYFSSRAADLAAAGIIEGEEELELEEELREQHLRNLRDTRRYDSDDDDSTDDGGQTPSPPPQARQKQKKSKVPKLKLKPKAKPKSKPKVDPDIMMVDATCTICYSAITNTVLIPCGHLVLCAVCTMTYN